MPPPLGQWCPLPWPKHACARPACERSRSDLAQVCRASRLAPSRPIWLSRRRSLPSALHGCGFSRRRCDTGRSLGRSAPAPCADVFLVCHGIDAGRADFRQCLGDRQCRPAGGRHPRQRGGAPQADRARLSVAQAEIDWLQARTQAEISPCWRPWPPAQAPRPRLTRRWWHVAGCAKRSGPECARGKKRGLPMRWILIASQSGLASAQGDVDRFRAEALLAPPSPCMRPCRPGCPAALSPPRLPWRKTCEAGNGPTRPQCPDRDHRG